IPQLIYDDMVAHAREGYPNEICGVVIGPPGEMRELHRARNVAADPLYTYDMDGADLLRLNQLADDQGWEFVCIYHSHPPFAEAYPSATDIAKAFYPDALYIILAIGRMPQHFREQLRARSKRDSVIAQMGDPAAMPPRMRAYRIVKEDLFSKDGRIEELEIAVG